MAQQDRLPEMTMNWRDDTAAVIRAKLDLERRMGEPWRDLYRGAVGFYAVFLSNEEVELGPGRRAVVAVRQGLGSRSLRIGVAPVGTPLGGLSGAQTGAIYPAAAIRLSDQPVAVRLGVLQREPVAYATPAIRWMPTFGVVIGSDDQLRLSSGPLDGFDADQVSRLGVPLLV